MTIEYIMETETEKTDIITREVEKLEISETTRKQYESVMRTLKSNNITITPLTTINELIQKLSLLRKVNGEAYKDSSNFLKAIKWSLKDSLEYEILKGGISEVLKGISKSNEIENDKNELSEKQRKNYLERDDIIRISRKVRNNKTLSQESHKEHVIISLYTLFDGVRRVKDYSEMYISSGDEINDITRNYYISEGLKGKMIFNNYKTAYIYGQQMYIISAELQNIITEYIKKYKVSGSLLGLTDGALKERIKTIFRRYVNMNIGVNIMRHSYIMYNEKQGNLTKERRKELASRMAHNVDMQLSYIKYIGDIEKLEIRKNEKCITKRGRKAVYTEEERKEAEKARKRKWRMNQKAKKGEEVNKNEEVEIVS